jgi:hypothetical protein
MGRWRVAGAQWLREVSRVAPKASKARIEIIINLHESSEIENLKTAENIVERLASEAARKICKDKTYLSYKLVGDATGRKPFDIATGIRKPDPKLKNVMVKMILVKQKVADPKAEQRKEKQAGEAPVNIDLLEGTSVKDALSDK